MNLSYNEKSSSSDRPKGHIQFVYTDAQTGEVLGTDEESNIVVNEHRKIVINRIYENKNDYRVRRVKIGDDVGTGTDNDPELPTKETSGTDMNVIFETVDNIEINYPDEERISFNIFFNGETIMNDYPDSDQIGFTSIGLFSLNDWCFSYRRFPSRTITENININIIWTIYYEDEE